VSDPTKRFHDQEDVPRTGVARVEIWRDSSHKRVYAVTTVPIQENRESEKQRHAIMFPPNKEGNLDNQMFRIVMLADPVDDQDAATKKYIDDITGWRGPSPAIGSIHIWASPGDDGFFGPGYDRQVLHSDSSQSDKLNWDRPTANIDGNDRYGFGIDGNR
jgi:hypothetical protein